MTFKCVFAVRLNNLKQNAEPLLEESFPSNSKSFIKNQSPQNNLLILVANWSNFLQMHDFLILEVFIQL